MAPCVLVVSHLCVFLHIVLRLLSTNTILYLYDPETNSAFIYYTISVAPGVEHQSLNGLEQLIAWLVTLYDIYAPCFPRVLVCPVTVTHDANGITALAQPTCILSEKSVTIATNVPSCTQRNPGRLLLRICERMARV